MAELLVLSEDEVRAVLPLDDLVESLEAALVALSEGKASVPARIAARTPAGLLAAMPGYVPGMGLAAKLVSVYPANARLGVATHQALIALFDEETGTPVALMDGGHVTAVRTAAVAAIAARTLARPEGASVAIIGAGVQAEAHLQGFAQLLSPSEIGVVARDPARAADLAGRYEALGAAPAATIEEAVQGADAVCCCTDAPEPVVKSEWIAPGTHVSSVGSGRELPAGLLIRGRVFVETRTAVEAPPAGAVELQGIDGRSLVEIGEVLAGREEGRASAEEITVFKSTGHAVEDVAAAALAYRRARAAGVGTTLAMGRSKT